MEGYTIVTPGDVVVNGLNLNYDLKSLRVGQVRENGVITSAYIIIRPEKINSDYFNYLLKGFDSIKTFHGMGKGIRLTLGYEELRRIYIPVPPLPEQSRIAAFLDERCGKIDEAIARHKALIEKLDEYRKAVITKAVTKGVRGERKMKESHIKDIPFIPADWNEGKVKTFYSFQTGFTPDTKNDLYYNEDGHEWLTIGDLTGDKLIPCSTKKHISDLYLSEHREVQAPKGSLLYSFKLSVGQVAFVDRPIFTNEALACFLPLKQTYLSFLFYSSILIERNANINIYNAAILNQKRIANAPIVFPSLEEQAEIVAYLDKKCAAIDAAKDRHQQLITKLEEYKKSLIYNAVTGKIEC